MTEQYRILGRMAVKDAHTEWYRGGTVQLSSGYTSPSTADQGLKWHVRNGCEGCNIEEYHSTENSDSVAFSDLF
jgi:hypothetical protein